MASTTPTTSALKASPLEGFIEVFKAGTHTDTSGKRFSFGAADLDAMVANHALGAAPAVLGHPKHDDPAYGWVDAYKREGDSLYAKFKDVNPAFAQGVQDGAYRNRSVSVYKDPAHGWRVRHVGWLGAVPPAIDGLAPIAFAAPEEECLEFSAPGFSLVWGLESVAKLLRGLREQMIAKDGLDAADAALPQWQIDSAIEAAGQARTEFQSDTCEPEAAAPLRNYSQPDGDAMTITPEQLQAAQAEAEKTKLDLAAMSAKFMATSAELLQVKQGQQAERIKASIEGWKAQGKLVGAQAAGLAEFMAQLDSEALEFSFSKPDGGEAKKTAAQYFAEFMDAQKPSIKLGVPVAAAEDGAAVDQGDPRAIANAAASFMAAQKAKGIEVSLPEAVAHATQKAQAS
jgi:hypothetical protein